MANFCQQDDGCRQLRSQKGGVGKCGDFMMGCCCLVIELCILFATPWTVAHQAPLSMQFPRQGYWSGLPVSPPGDLPDPGIKPASPALAGRFFTAEPPEKQ